MNNNRNMLKWRLLLVLATCFVIFIAGYGTAAGQTVKFTKLELKKNQVYQGRKQLQLHYSFDIKGIKGHRYRLYAYIYCTDQEIHKFSNGKQMFKTSDVISFNNNTTMGIKGWVGFYVNEMNPHPGTRTYNVEAFVKDLNTNKWIAHSKFLPFKMQGGTNNSPSRPNQPSRPTQPAQPTRPQGGGTREKCIVCNGSGVLYEYCGHVENTTEPIFCTACRTSHCKLCTTHKQCPVCSGQGHYDGKTCTSCNGSGLYFDPWSCRHLYSESGSLYEYCSLCNYRHCTRCSCHKRCMGCNGTGYVTY